jgi:hypothetical protein
MATYFRVTIKPYLEKNDLDFKSISYDKNYSKFNIFFNLCLKITKSLPGHPTHQGLSNNTKIS